jgi:hypothetical protein
MVADEKPSKKGWDHQMKKVLLGAAALTALGFALTGCATRSQDIVSAYVSPIQYESYSCAQLREEAARVSSRAALASGMQDQNATSDAVATGVALVVFWPAAFLVHGNGANAQEVSQLKGDMDAIEQANVRKRCGIQFSRHTAS